MFISVAVLYKDLKYDELSIDYKPFKNYLVYSSLEMKTKKYKTKRIKGTYKGTSGVKTHKLKRIPNEKKKHYPKRLLKFIYNKVLRKNKSHNGASKKNKVSRDVDVLVQKAPDSCESEVNELNKILQDSCGTPDISSELTKIEKSISEEECTPELLNYLRDFIVLLFSRRTVLENIVDENQHTCQHNHSNNYLCDLCSTKQKLLKDLHERRNNISRDMETILKIIKECIHIINKYDMIHYQYKKHNGINEEKCSKDDFMRLVREYEELIVQEHINRCFHDYNKQSLDKCTKCKSEMLVSNICRICTSINNSKNNLYKVINIIEIEIQGKLTQIFQCENYLFNLVNRNILRTASERRNWLKEIYKRQLQEIKANNKTSNEEANNEVSLGSQNISVIGQLTNFGINARKFFSDISSTFKEKEEAEKIVLENQLKVKLESIRNKAEIEEQKHIKINSELKQGVCTEDSLKTFLEKKDKYLKCFNSSLTSFMRCNINCNDKNCYLCEQETISKRKRCFYKLQEIKEKLILCLKIKGWTLEDIEKELKDILDIE
ncbi:uncharacterized protein CMU_004430 [Cryptosporidium muris RN66]|uniref:Uncharacterized protein n=1 Tax=Cryptosporidium muris (strain RN66) TaxID=441375 RepID=B6AK53_CRYMR|nr:uncharacterized protein CMU_004430 [Cryptosporidium muris RN66]EEA08594.1 hypothetical protein CMU_004430 [Cryptosporidium muris RN66]|eukprot:XP_002142943.1 hypothetical protein [Cryptosporidium muris RN66]